MAPRAWTKEEARKDFLEHAYSIAKYWATLNIHEPEKDTTKYRCEGVVFSLLNIFDGSTYLPAMDILLRPHPEDKDFHIGQGENYYEDGMVINDDCHLHEIKIEEI